MINVLIGIISGAVSGMGMGGGTILILCLSLFLGIDQHIAQGANLVFFIPTSIVVIIMNAKQKLINWKKGIIVLIFGIIGAGFGANVSIKLNTNHLKLYFGIFLLCIASFEIYSLLFKKKK